uniref:Lipoprotein n=1 Tax=Salinispora arenicola (strain CNS-205) TaxID=391037 RepID=A8M3R5_SALAI
MRRVLAILSLPLLLVAGCAPAGSEPAAAPSPTGRQAMFEQRAAQIAAAWQPGPEWRDGYVPLQEPTIPVGDPGFTPDTRTAFHAGWYREQLSIPTARPKDGTIRFVEGSLTVPLVSAAEAYRELDRGDPPACGGRPTNPATPPPAQPDGPDAGVSSSPQTACIPLTVTAVELDSVPVRTSRGEAQVPAWLFTIDELTAPVARLAVAPDAVGVPPEPAASTAPLSEEVVGAQDLRAVDGATLTVRLGIGACDTGLTPLVYERDDVVVVGGGVTRATGVCTEQLLLEPVTVRLAAPLGERTVLDVLGGAPLRLTTG